MSFERVVADVVDAVDRRGARRRGRRRQRTASATSRREHTAGKAICATVVERRSGTARCGSTTRPRVVQAAPAASARCPRASRPGARRPRAARARRPRRRAPVRRRSSAPRAARHRDRLGRRARRCTAAAIFAALAPMPSCTPGAVVRGARGDLVLVAAEGHHHHRDAGRERLDDRAVTGVRDHQRGVLQDLGVRRGLARRGRSAARRRWPGRPRDPS